MTSFDTIIAGLLKNEGAYANNKDDLGGETNFGITAATARSYGYTGPMSSLPRAKAVEIYQSLYWTKPNYSEVYKLSPGIAIELLDTGVNMGTQVASEFLQRSLNSLNRGGKDYADLVVDGNLGPKSLKALSTFLTFRGHDEAEHVLLKALNCLQGARYIALCEARQANETFLFGWLANRVDLSV